MLKIGMNLRRDLQLRDGSCYLSIGVGSASHTRRSSRNMVILIASSLTRSKTLKVVNMRPCSRTPSMF